ncbi:MAG: DsbA family protein, partial [Bosea sp. (in: a-proteobacteria)]
MPNRPTLDFWYDFASTYSYLSAMRIEDMAQEAGIDIRWKP